MIDKEKVIKGLEICTTRPCYCTDCPYKANCVLDSQELMEDVLVLLKEQEAVEPKRDCELNELNMMINTYYCGNCGKKITGKGKFCSNCGKAVKWDDN